MKYNNNKYNSNKKYKATRRTIATRSTYNNNNKKNNSYNKKNVIILHFSCNFNVFTSSLLLFTIIWLVGGYPHVLLLFLFHIFSVNINIMHLLYSYTKRFSFNVGNFNVMPSSSRIY